MLKQIQTESIASSIHNKDLLEIMCTFLNTKDHANFGQLAYVHGRIFGANEEISTRLAAAIELLVLSFDIFDDLEDMDNEKEPWMQISPSIAMNAASLLYTASQSILSEMDNGDQLLKLSSRLSMQAMEGQHEDLANSADTEEKCLEMMRKKSGSLIALACAMGTCCGRKDPLPEVEQYAYQIGIAAQTENDFRGLFSTEKNDIRAEKNTLALLYINRQFNSHSEDLLKFFRSGKTFTEEYGTLEAYKTKLFNAGVIHYLNVIKQIAIQKASSILDQLPLQADQIGILKSHLIINNKKGDEKTCKKS
ncbi:polyprenyl synthetase family protein [Metabacillus sp. GX 13764]|uniref:polyprenyl synthetase family protein n=1 Tax=Metabacillus kandeliae TaxID=2900151 RepID=UPI001E395995|nr:polyprenyl synthetase family protein [Metabacillus kandeliae]MCD7035728.1 polyprenyl synthetase family protein [Metabacillus kandeliae]